MNFKKNERQYQAEKSEVLKFLREEESGVSTPGNCYDTQQLAKLLWLLNRRPDIDQDLRADDDDSSPSIIQKNNSN